MPKYSAGVLPYRHDGEDLLVFLAHPGGPYWASKDEGVWSVVKGEYDPATEEPMIAAAREFAEEIGVAPPPQPWLDLGEARHSSAKIVRAYAVESSSSLAFLESNTCEVEWPPRSGKHLTIPEVDRAEWMPLHDARRRILKGQRPLLDRLTALTGETHPPDST
ncbi:NUDIX domain-containing protein [Mobilicoccus caccae]|uniref:NTP pyrophosphohydrolase n=1 Tax=Mobilicoccus caccae TaxID=1859295 RepID=A0ABQ6IWA6_9MICO|nr:NUDIX domain-containing protein [Mobilicoccus caccae]GMA42207.1 NTP pyrophosphohydrolase [Mobilicoccus caccae]